MLETEVLRDFRKLKVKLAFGLTKRQLLCFSGAALIGFPLYFLFLKLAGSTIAMFMMIIVMVPFFLLAMYERYGEPFEKVVMHVINFEKRRPKVRVYATNNVYRNIETVDQIRKEVKEHAASMETKGRDSSLHASKKQINKAGKKNISKDHQTSYRSKK